MDAPASDMDAPASDMDAPASDMDAPPSAMDAPPSAMDAPPPVLDTTPPNITFRLERVSLLSNETIEFTVSVTDNRDNNLTPSIACDNGGEYSNGIFTAPMVSADISIECIAIAEDSAGNVTSESIILTISPPAGFGAVVKNIMVILLDDADFSDFGFNNELLVAPDAETPNMDDIRSNGKLLRNFYTGSSICSPSRVSLLTGRNPMAFGALGSWVGGAVGRTQRDGNSNGLPRNIPQLGLMMKEMGKVTAHYGKWHVGSVYESYRHAALGFDKFAIHRPTGLTRGWSGEFEFTTETHQYVKDIDYIDYEYGEMVENFIIDNANSPNGFFINYWPLTPHFPWSPPESFDNSQTNFDLSTDRGKLLAMMYSVDQQIGDIVQVLKDTGQYDDTLILITSDNGGVRTVKNDSPSLSGNKGALLEGGLKVSLVAHWPAEILPNTSNQSVVSMYDLLPTLLDVAGYENTEALNPEIEGRSKRQVLFDDRIIPHDPIIWETHIPGNSRSDDELGDKSYAILKDNLRLVKHEGRAPETHPNPYALFDIEQTPFGFPSIAGNNSTIVDQLAAELETARKAISRIPYIPSQITGPVTLNADPSMNDPRLDVTSKDFTFEFDISVPETVLEQKILFHKEGTSKLTLETDRSLRWEITGVDDTSSPVTETLTTSPLSVGFHEINLGINGYRVDRPLIRLYVDGVIAADADTESGHPSEIYSLLRQMSPLHLGAENITMNNVNYYQLKFYPGE